VAASSLYQPWSEARLFYSEENNTTAATQQPSPETLRHTLPKHRRNLQRLHAPGDPYASLLVLPSSFLHRRGVMWGHPHVTPASHCSPSSVPTPINTPTQPTASYPNRKPLFHSLLLCPYTHQYTEPTDSILTNLSLPPSLSTAKQRKRPLITELHTTSHADQLCPPASGRADWTAGYLYIRRPTNQREAV